MHHPLSLQAVNNCTNHDLSTSVTIQTIAGNPKLYEWLGWQVLVMIIVVRRTAPPCG